MKNTRHMQTGDGKTKQPEEKARHHSKSAGLQEGVGALRWAAEYNFED